MGGNETAIMYSVFAVPYHPEHMYWSTEYTGLVLSTAAYQSNLRTGPFCRAIYIRVPTYRPVLASYNPTYSTTSPKPSPSTYQFMPRTGTLLCSPHLTNHAWPEMSISSKLDGDTWSPVSAPKDLNNLPS